MHLPVHWEPSRPAVVLAFFALLSGSIFGQNVRVAAIPSLEPRPMQRHRLEERAEINAPLKKFGTIKHDNMTGYPEFNVFAKDNLSSWDDDTGTLTSNQFLPHMFQAYLHMANGYLGCSLANNGPIFDRDFNQTTWNGTAPTEGWPLDSPRQTKCFVSGFFDRQPDTPRTNYEHLKELGDESVISGIPHFMGILIKIGNETFDANVLKGTIAEPRASWNFKQGIYAWSSVWKPPGQNASLKIIYTSIAHRSRPNVAATQLQVTPLTGNAKVTIIDVFDGRSAERSYLGEKALESSTIPAMSISVHPNGMPSVTAHLVSTVNISNGYTDEASRRSWKHPENEAMSLGQEWDVFLLEGEPAIIEKYIGVASTDKFTNASKTAREESLRAYKDGWEQVEAEHVNAWEKIMDSFSLNDYRHPDPDNFHNSTHLEKYFHNSTLLEKVQISATADYYNIMQNLLPVWSGLDDEGISVGGLTSDTYAGQFFWDSDFWINPAINVIRPEYARQIINHRLKQLPMAKENAQASYVQAKYKFPKEAALYPWTTGRWGNASALGPVLDYEYHLNADIALSVFQHLDVTGDMKTFTEEFYPMVEAVCHSIATLLIPNEDGTVYSLYNATDPDEWVNNIDNPAFTLTAFATVLKQTTSFQAQHGLPVNTTWVDMAGKVNIARAPSGITMQHSKMNSTGQFKQADVTLMTYPLNSQLIMGYSLAQQRMDLDYYSQKQSGDGPAMTTAIAAIDQNRIGKSGCSAWTRHVEALSPHLRGPWFQMSEQADDDSNANGGVKPSLPFLTGSGGNLQIPLFGYLGITQLLDEFTIRPTLPAPLKHLRVPDVHSKGNKFRASMNNTHTNITRLPANLPGVLFDQYPNQPMPFVVESRRTATEGTEDYIHSEKYWIQMNQTVTVENDMYWQRPTIDKNILQCQITESQGEHHHVPGKPPGAATDGVSDTSWQPLTQNPTRIKIDTSTAKYQEITKIVLEYGQRTPATVRMLYTNDTVKNDLPSISNCTNVIELSVEIAPEARYNESLPNHDVGLSKGNKTEFRAILDGKPVWSGDYVYLEIEGCQGCPELTQITYENGTTVWKDDAKGAYVAEFSAVGSKGTDIKQTLKDMMPGDRLAVDDELPNLKEEHDDALKAMLESGGTPP